MIACLGGYLFSEDILIVSLFLIINLYLNTSCVSFYLLITGYYLVLFLYNFVYNFIVFL